MPEYTPTTTEARALYVTGTPRDISVAEGNAEFDRWLAAHDAEVLASRDAEVEALVGKIDKDRQRCAEAVLNEELRTARATEQRDAEVEVLREQLAAAEAVIARVYKMAHEDSVAAWGSHQALMQLVCDPDEGLPVLAAHDCEVAARTLEAFDADLHEWYPEDVFPRPSAEGYRLLHEELTHAGLTLDVFSADLMRRAGHLARDRAAALRSGTEGTKERHPEYEYATTTGPRKAWDDYDRPPDHRDGWEPDPDRLGTRDSWERFDYHEERYWRRKVERSTDD